MLTSGSIAFMPPGLALEGAIRIDHYSSTDGPISERMGRAERHHVRPAEAAFRAHLRKPQETFGKSVVNV